jgi:hypothetical protein
MQPFEELNEIGIIVLSRQNACDVCAGQRVSESIFLCVLSFLMMSSAIRTDGDCSPMSRGWIIRLVQYFNHRAPIVTLSHLAKTADGNFIHCGRTEILADGGSDDERNAGMSV